jgi:murein DD-endopeptidase MepM/ murein hydrolase activator NlpD
MKISNRLLRSIPVIVLMVFGGMMVPVTTGRAERQSGADLEQKTQTPTPTPLVQITGSPTSQSFTPTATLATPPAEQGGNGDFLNLVFPTPGPAPISAWRPPLYPVPWAAGEHDHFFFQRPIAADTINWPVADYRYGGIFFRPDVVHTGVDIDAPAGTPVLAAAAGKVVWVGYGLFSVAGNMEDPYGLAVAIRHDFGLNGKRLFTIYAHMRAITVVNGQQVQAGDQIGEVGETGATTGPHLHFEVRLGRNYFFDTRNPELWIAPPQGWGVLVGRITDKHDKPLTHIELHVYAVDDDHDWIVRTYGPIVVNPDEYYQENLVLSDLPAGKYRLWINYAENDYYGKFEIYPGTITLIKFTGEKGFSIQDQTPAFTPVPVTPVPVAPVKATPVP